MTENSDPKLSEVARHIVMPSGIVTSMFPKVNKRAKACGIRYDRWQQGLLTLILGRRTDGTFAASVGGVVFQRPPRPARPSPSPASWSSCARSSRT